MIYAFLSSPVRRLEDIRKEVHALQLPDGKRIWVDEIDKPDRKEPSLVTIEDLFNMIREASVFIILLASERRGSNLTIYNESAHVTYWEAELYYVALLGKPVRVFEVEDFQPSEDLASLLSLLKGALPTASWSKLKSLNDVPRAVHSFLLKQASEPTEKAKFGRSLLPTLVDGLLALRGKDGCGGSAEGESLKFLNGSFADATVVPNEALITRLLAEVHTLSNEEGRLTRLWIVFRELMGAPVGSNQYSDFLPYWNKFFGEWASAGSWYGLHGHPQLAVLPALVEQAKIRKQIRSIGSSAWKDENTTYPGGALASSRYSIAGLTGSWRNRRFLLHAALADIERSLENQEPTNLLAIRGSIYRRLGAFCAAVRDYEEVLRRRRSVGAPDSAVGEALSELGYGCLFNMRLWRGRALLEEGVRLLSNCEARPGFLIRAKRKLAVAYALTGHPLRARDELNEARYLARSHSVFDQIR